MRGPAAAVRDVGRWHASQRAARAVVLVAPLVALLAAGLAGNAPAAWVLLAVALLSLRWAMLPESGAGVLALLVVLAWWTRVPDDALHPAALLAAAAVLVAHLAAVVSGAAPPRTPVDRAVLRLWTLRGAGLFAAPPVLWVLARALRDEVAPAGLWPAALVGALVVVVVLTVGLRRDDEVS